ncbi:hypothetical protein D9611_001336 [Ephemerocybe angulata]|uniref:Uncharacterized protein n=1 Tax=Ephemerocybe angulata TaxID=980116 RepID=A0A8H5CJ00_9AGAR|nr:hypothetical protein D9611_001336 [Tulosesus angulatus]
MLWPTHQHAGSCNRSSPAHHPQALRTTRKSRAHDRNVEKSHRTCDDAGCRELTRPPPTGNFVHTLPIPKMRRVRPFTRVPNVVAPNRPHFAKDFRPSRTRALFARDFNKASCKGPVRPPSAYNLVRTQALRPSTYRRQQQAGKLTTSRTPEPAHSTGNDATETIDFQPDREQ